MPKIYFKMLKMNYSLVPSTRFKKSLKKYLNKPAEKNKIIKLLDVLKTRGFAAVPLKMKPHKLIGNYRECLEFHIMPDLLIIWEQDDEAREIYLLDIGSHSDLF